MSAPQHWAVTVAVDGVDILTIESNCLSGVENVCDYQDAIATAARHLLSFIGEGEQIDWAARAALPQEREK